MGGDAEFGRIFLKAETVHVTRENKGMERSERKDRLVRSGREHELVAAETPAGNHCRSDYLLILLLIHFSLFFLHVFRQEEAEREASLEGMILDASSCPWSCDYK